MKKLTAIEIFVLFFIGILLFAAGVAIGMIGEESKPVDIAPYHTKVIEQCNRINLLSCIACHDFPAYVIDVQPEIWEE